MFYVDYFVKINRWPLKSECDVSYYKMNKIKFFLISKALTIVLL